jgi:hypothetical protein
MLAEFDRTGESQISPTDPDSRSPSMQHTCPFHGWTFNNSGKLLKVKDPDDAGCPSVHDPLRFRNLRPCG